MRLKHLNALKLWSAAVVLTLGSGCADTEPAADETDTDGPSSSSATSSGSEGSGPDAGSPSTSGSSSDSTTGTTGGSSGGADDTSESGETTGEPPTPVDCAEGPMAEICGNGVDEDCDGEDWVCPDSAIYVDNVIGSDGGDGSMGDPVSTIARGVELASAGTVVFVQATDIGYEGICLETDGVMLVGLGGQPTIDGAVECDGRMALMYSRADDIRFENFHLDASELGGISLRALIFSGLPDEPIYRNEARFIDALGPGVAPGGLALISASLCYDCLLEYSSSIESEDHGIYWTNHQDGSVIRGNLVTRADGACLQFNADPETNDPSHPFQDGLMSDGLIENNILVDCGNEAGGAALNLAGVVDTVFRNNIMYGEPFNGGVAMWDDGYSDWGESGNFNFGCTGNTFVHNTIDCRGCDRHALSLRNGSTGNVVKNNIFITAEFDAIAIDAESIGTNDVDFNVYVEDTIFEGPDEAWVDIDTWRTATGHDQNSAVAPLQSLFTDLDTDDYHLAKGSGAVDMGDTLPASLDFDGIPRPQGAGPDAGAFEREER